MTYRPHLDGIRAIAVIAVILFHAHVPGFSGGFVGVDVFFVISGYLISGMLLTELEQTGSISVRRFIERRIRRLAPALFVVLAATLVVGGVVLSPIGGEVQGLAKSAIAAVLLVANHYFMFGSGGYFDPPPYSLPLLHTWSLSVEEQFYLVWPWLLIAAGVFAARHGMASVKSVGWLMGLVASASLLACILVTGVDQEAAFYLTPLRAWEFALGAIVFLFLRRKSTALATPIAFAGLVAIAAAIAVFTEDMAFPGWIAILPVLGTCALIYGSEAHPEGPVAKGLSLRPMVWTGLLSYSLYLWHWPVFTFARVTLMGDFGLPLAAGLTLLSLLLAWLTFRYVEQPIRNKRWTLMIDRQRAFRVGAVLSLLVVFVAVGEGAWAKLVWPRMPGNAELAAKLSTSRKPDWGCSSELQVRLPPDREDRGCLTGPGAPATVLIWGDSHAGHLKAALANMAATREQPGLLVYRPQCPPALDFAQVPKRGEVESCSSFNDAVMAELRRRPHMQTVFLSAHWLDYARPDDASGLQQAIERMVAALEQENRRVILVASGVDFPYPVPECVRRRGATACDLTRAAAERRRAIAERVIHAVARAHPGLVVVDPMAELCTRERCPVSRGGHLLYSDQHHLSVFGAETLAPALALAAEDIPRMAGVAR